MIPMCGSGRDCQLLENEDRKAAIDLAKELMEDGRTYSHAIYTLKKHLDITLLDAITVMEDAGFTLNRRSK